MIFLNDPLSKTTILTFVFFSVIILIAGAIFHVHVHAVWADMKGYFISGGIAITILTSYLIANIKNERK